MHYNFYFDETFHDRKITVKSSGKINTLDEDKNDCYIGVFWGFDSAKRSSITKQLHQLENKYLSRLGIENEFKSTTFSKKNFRNGIRSFGKDTLDFYLDFFAVLDKLDPIIHINTVSKIELLLRKVIPFEKVESCPYVDSNAFYYSLTKFVLTYHTPQLIQALAVSRRKSSCELFREELVNHLETVIATIRKIKRKEREAPALQQLHMILSSIRLDSTISDKYDFVYRQNFVGLSRLLVERGISPQNVAVFIDREEHTFRAAADFSFARVKQTDSSGSIHIRVSDHLCGYIGRTLYALSNDANLKEETVTDISQLAKNDIVRKHILSQEWFDLTEKQYELYQLVGKVLILRQPSYWSTMTWSYCDQVVMFYSLLRYMASYGCFEEFRKISPALHAEYFNSACCDELDRVYSNWS